MKPMRLVAVIAALCAITSDFASAQPEQPPIQTSAAPHVGLPSGFDEVFSHHYARVDGIRCITSSAALSMHLSSYCYMAGHKPGTPGVT